MVTKERFCYLLRKIRKADELAHSVGSLFRDFDDCINYDTLWELPIYFICDVEMLLAESINQENPKVLFDVIEAFLYEMDFGNDTKYATLYNQDGSVFLVLDSPEVLYDYLLTL